MEKPLWDAERYLRFVRERSQPARDLAWRIPLDRADRVIDLGCGPGNSTAILAERYPSAALIGLDSSPDMLAKARSDPALAGYKIDWRLGDIQGWSPRETFDIIFSNAALHWLSDHARLIPALFGHVAEGGILAFQVPDNFASPDHTLIHDIASEEPWASKLGPLAETAAVERPERYYDLLAPLAARIDIWRTDYYHVMQSHDAIVDWMRTTGLRPVLGALAPEFAESFLTRYLAGLKEAFLPQADGQVLLRFSRIFVVAGR